MRYLSCLLLAAALTGCATSTAPVSTPAAAAGPYRDTIALAGRFSATYPKDGQPQNIVVKYTWHQQPGRIDVAIASPLDQTLATISVTPQAATLTEAGKPPRVARDIDTLTAQTLGWSLPVGGLTDWLQGYATDANGKRFAASPAHNSVVTNDGWRLRFVAWQEGTATPLPRRIDAERSATPTSDELALRILIDPAG